MSRSQRPRTLILCFDGTSNEYSGQNTNVVKLYSLFKRNDPEEQMCYYQAGIGTYFKPGVISPMFSWLAKIADEAIAWYLDVHVMEGYTFLMQNYRAGDKICIFGFSRGAYTARALGGMLFKVGLLPKDNPEQVPFAYKLFQRTDEAGLQLAAGFKQTFAQDVSVEFMGVWDTVGSIGVLRSKTLPFTNSNSSIKTFRHALSLDERRAKFRPNLFHRPSPNPSHDPEDASPVMSRKGTLANLKVPPLFVPSSPKGLGFMRRMSSRRKRASIEKQRQSEDQPILDDKRRETSADLPHITANDPNSDLDVLEVWFAGCHGDVGGGCLPDANRTSLAQITLQWMVKEIAASQCGIIFDDAALDRNDIDLKIFPSKGSEDDPEDQYVQRLELEAKQPLHDMCKEAPLWWLLEIIPLPHSFQDGQGVWHKNWSFNMGKGRMIPDNVPNFHISVKDRLNDDTLNYKPKAQWKAGTERFVP